MDASDPGTRLLLVGVIHGDAMAADGLRDLLDRVRPDRVTLEVSPFSIAFRERHGARLRAIVHRRLLRLGLAADQGALAWLHRYLAPPYEWSVARSWCRSHGVGLSLLGDARVAASHLDHIEEELIAAANLVHLAHRDDPTAPEELLRARRVARQALEGSRPFHFGGDRHLLRVTDAAMAASVRACRRSLGPGRTLMHIAGWEHVVRREGLPNLASQLADLRPEVLFA